ncbi:MAG: hypothetical protein PHN75_07755 [Syntrophales bacterium]|nr:hypothetical protein [Syntrophales bacterium]
MARDENIVPLDVLFEEKTRVFERGEDYEHDSELDEMICDFGDYENEEPLQEAGAFKKKVPQEEELVEKEMVHTDRGRTNLKEREYIGDKEPIDGKLVDIRPLRIEIDANNAEIVCGQISVTKKNKLEAYCRESEVTVSDIWYDDGTMAAVMGKKWQAWYKVDNSFHEIGIINDDLKPHAIKLYLDDEPLGDVDMDLISIYCEEIPKPKSKKACISVTAGVVNEAKYTFGLEISDDFDPKKLSFHYKDLTKIGLTKMLLTDVRYGNRVMDFSHQDYENEDVLDVAFIS